MSVVEIDLASMPEDERAVFEERSRGRAGAVESTDGFEWFELLRPVTGTDQYLVYTRWSSEEAHHAWPSGQEFDRAHSGGGDTLAPVASGSQVWHVEVIEQAAATAHGDGAAGGR